MPHALLPWSLERFFFCLFLACSGPACERRLEAMPDVLALPEALCSAGGVRLWSWSYENTLGGALTRRDFGEVAAFGHFAEFGRLFLPEALLMRMSDRFKCFASRTEA